MGDWKTRFPGADPPGFGQTSAPEARFPRSVLLPSADRIYDSPSSSTNVVDRVRRSPLRLSNAFHGEGRRTPAGRPKLDRERGQHAMERASYVGTLQFAVEQSPLSVPKMRRSSSLRGGVNRDLVMKELDTVRPRTSQLAARFNHRAPTPLRQRAMAAIMLPSDSSSSASVARRGRYGEARSWLPHEYLTVAKASETSPLRLSAMRRMPPTESLAANVVEEGTLLDPFGSGSIVFELRRSSRAQRDPRTSAMSSKCPRFPWQATRSSTSMSSREKGVETDQRAEPEQQEEEEEEEEEGDGGDNDYHDDRKHHGELHRGDEEGAETAATPRTEERQNSAANDSSVLVSDGLGDDSNLEGEIDADGLLTSATATQQAMSAEELLASFLVSDDPQFCLPPPASTTTSSTTAGSVPGSAMTSAVTAGVSLGTGGSGAGGSSKANDYPWGRPLPAPVGSVAHRIQKTRMAYSCMRSPVPRFGAPKTGHF